MQGVPSEPSEATRPVTGSRRLAAVVFVDIVGYSMLMATDEPRTHRRWMEILNEIIRPRAAAHHGKIVKSTGDGVLAEFVSALDAVEWGLAVHRAIHLLHESAQSDQPTIALRIAVHLGDVVSTDDDIYGDGVNVAARLQEYANPGGIVLSEAVYDLVRGSIGDRVRDIGYLELKNFEKPVKAYALDPEIGAVTVSARPREDLLPSIAILPFQNLTGNPEDDYFADGIVEDIIVSLSGLHELMVISRGSTLRYRAQHADPREIGRALGVRYVLLGSIRRLVRPVRVSTRLIDAITGASLWGDRSDIDAGDLFDVQDRIVWRVVGGIAPHVRAAELRRSMRKRPDSFTAYDHTLRALDLISRLDRPRFLQAREFLDKAMELDPGFAMPFAWAARWHSLLIGQGWASDRSKETAAAIGLATRAIELDRGNALALATMGHLKSTLFHEYDTALLYFDRALSACPNSSLAWILSSATLAYVSRGSEAVKNAEHGLRLSPHDQGLFFFYGCLALAHYANGDFEEALRWAQMSESENGAYTANLRYLIAILVAVDRVAEAREAARRLLEYEPNFRIGEAQRNRPAFRDPEIRGKFTERLQIAGLPT